MKKLNKKFFARDTLKVARGLLGKVIVRKWRGKFIRAIISETEAYKGIKDKASHASKGLTVRTQIMFGFAGRIYIYLVYGMHYCFNIVTEPAGYPAAVLIRGIMNIDSGEQINGPGRVTRFLRLDKKMNAQDICRHKEIWIEMTKNIPQKNIKTGKRIGVDYAGTWKNKLWRFYIDQRKIKNMKF
jgi:DNA-3-methyladenine glycosylase